MLPADINVKRLKKIIVSAHEQHPQDFETLLELRGVGPATIRSLSLLAEIIFQAPPSRRDPATPREELPPSKSDPRQWADYSYAHGGKDGTPFPVDRANYDQNIAVLTDAVRKAREQDIRQVEMEVKGPGSGRDAALRAISAEGLKITTIRDVTPVPHNGCKPPKMRRI